ncbi:helix-turn-helix domain-containing protein, partial [Caldivirga sp. MU80]|uniref:helix-turn-helix domain-containing protein n=1 Tax=Caldivirga sp. MU80 TaxID=1650354 RepID=UPI003513F041
MDESVGRSPTVFTTLGTQSSSTPKSKGRKSRSEEMRTVRLRLLPNGTQERKLRRIADATARLWNELNYARLVQYRASGKV